ncbi:hypothetical protein A2W15_06205 [Candidatus Woesebacteria bacterium RBG_16_41_13]|nr:MAG: hypothetical protein A2W15_06205 [Candidatus Woesebacteria bacterium RBG_16_41_13]
MSQQERKSGGISRRKFLGLAVVATGTAVAGAVGIKVLSSGNGKEKAAVVKSPTAEPTNKPPATETIAQTPIPSPEPSPTPEPTQFVPKKLSEAQFVETSYDAFLKSVNDAYRIHPDAEEVHFTDSEEKITRDKWINNNLTVIKDGDPSSPKYPASIEGDRFRASYNLVNFLIFIYKETGYPDFYQASVDVANYYLTERPGNKAQFDETLQNIIHDTSPSIEK